MTIQACSAKTSDGLQEGMEWLVQHMPSEDLQSLSADFLIENVKLSYDSWERAPCECLSWDHPSYECLS